MEQMTEQLKRLLASQFSLYLKIWGFHWNLIGSDFAERHALYGDWKDELSEDIDLIAERIRQCGGVVEAGLGHFKESSSVDDTNPCLIDEEDSAEEILEGFHVLRSLVTELIDMAEECDKVTSNIAHDLGAEYDKRIWFLESILHGETPEDAEEDAKEANWEPDGDETDGKEPEGPEEDHAELVISM